MSEITLFAKGGNTLPAHLQNLDLDETTRALMGGSGGMGGKRISIRGGVFRMMVDGKEVAQNEDRAMNVVVVKSAQHIARSYYSGTYVEGENAKPACTSADGVKPDANVAKRQSNTCADCPQNIKGSGQGESRACRFNQKLAVALEHDIGGDIYQLQLPGQSLFGTGEGNKMPLQQYAKLLGGHNIPITAVVTELRFDTASATPKLTFRAQRPLTPAEIALVKEQGQHPDAIAAVASGAPSAGSAPAAPTQALFAAPAPAAADEPTDVEPKKAKSTKPTPPPVASTKTAEALVDSWSDDE